MNTLAEKHHEQHLGTVVRQALDSACRDLPDTVTTRLANARQQALQQQKQATGLQLAGFSHLVIDHLGRPLRTGMAVLALLTGMAGTWYWNTLQEAEDNIDVDTALLSDELPVAAYTDAGFRAWLERNTVTDN